ncbi:karyopherin Kap104 [Schizosaccharomyces octosporus yFS286]|uniref:Karyopherin Kap104 n=1 Tax=Schizosaccharomyces octosporus (strain yFS286) TaxID=483514 RepID=S9Q0Z5_SCHOY|nr:karyopherin Kap104 [Schizosaccharomyces octosporus yFS286]EPX73852.1 karyopherin Kap104 [Schizosaccharomyces octosporus yFS286]
MGDNPWVLQEQVLLQLSEVIKNSLSEDSQTRAAALNLLEKTKDIPDVNNYLACILINGAELSVPIRSAAGLLLKNNLRVSNIELAHGLQSLDYTKSTVVRGLCDSQPLIRGISGNVITTLISRWGVSTWPEVLPQLMDMLSGSTPSTTQEGAFSALTKICEDSARELDRDFDGTRPLDFMIPRFIELARNENPKIRTDALFCLNQFLLIQSQSLYAHIDTFLETCYSLATDTSPNVRKNVCQALVYLLDVRPDKIAPSLGSIVEYMLYSTQDMDQTVALEACEFWLAISEQPDLCSSLGPYLDKIVPMLLRGMVYSDMDLLLLGNDADDYNVEDRLEDIRPQHAKGKSRVTMDTEGPAGRQGGANDEFDELEEEDEDDDEFDDDDEDADAFMDWNLRKCSAAALDALSASWSQKLLEVILPHLKDSLMSSDWKIQEAGVLALGAIAEGCMDGMIQYLPELYPYLLSLLDSNKPLVRTITCWTLGRYSSWATCLDSEVDRQKYFIPLIEKLLRMVVDNNKKVQEAGCSAFAILEEQAGHTLVPFLEPILTNFAFAFQKYQRKNLLILYDAVQTLADYVGPVLNEKRYVELLMPPLLQKWSTISEDDPNIFPLLECLSSVAVALKEGFAPFAAETYARTFRMLHNTLYLIDASQTDPSIDVPDRDFLVTTLDLISGIIQALGSQIAPLIAQADPPMGQIIGVCAKDEVAEVRQSAYALLGDMCMFCFDQIRPYCDALLLDMLPQMQMPLLHVSASNNAIWSAGEMALQLGKDMQPWVKPLLERLICIIQSGKANSTVLENVAITIGRLGMYNPELVAPHLQLFYQPWFEIIKTIGENEEKDSAFRGFCNILACNPQSLSYLLPMFVTCVAEYEKPSMELQDMFQKILQGSIEMFNGKAAWQASPDMMAQIQLRYGV